MFWRQVVEGQSMKLFISYSHDDRVRVEELIQHLKDGGHEIWYDNEIRTGKEWEKEIINQVKSSEAFIYFLSQSSLKSPHCNREYQTAKKAHIAIFPILIDKNAKDEIPKDVKKIQYVDCSISFEMSKVLKLLRDLKEVENRLIAERVRKEEITKTQRKGKREEPSSEFIDVIAPIAIEFLKLKTTEEKYIRELKERANEYLQAEIWDKVLTKVNEIIAFEGPQAKSYAIRGNANAKLGNNSIAVNDYTTAINLSQNDATNYYNRASILQMMRERVKALADFNVAIRLNPEYAEAYCNRGIVYCETGEYAKGLEDYNEAIRLNPILTEAYNNRGDLFKRMRQWVKALADYNEAIRLNPEYAEAYCNRGTVYCETGEYAKGLEDYNEAIRLNPTLIEAHNNRGNVYSEIGEYAKGLEDYNEAIRLILTIH